MPFVEKNFEKIDRRIKDANRKIKGLYQFCGDKKVLRKYIITNETPQQLSDTLGITLQEAEYLIRRSSGDENAQENNLNELYDRALAFVSENGNEDPDDLADELDITTAAAKKLLKMMRERGDIADNDECADDDEFDEKEFEDEEEAEFEEGSLEDTIVKAVDFVADTVCDTCDEMEDVLDKSMDKLENGLGKVFDKLVDLFDIN